MTPDKKPYFGPLDSLRTYAFFIVFISHAYLSFFTETYQHSRWFAHGEVGVQIFFVLSAFLITYLSLSEYKKTNNFSILNFFKKRILRIWPVYFLVLAISYIWHLIAAPEQILDCATRFIYFFGNTCMLQGFPDIIGSPTVDPMWSVSVEQQFYVVFPIGLLIYVAWKRKTHMRALQYLIHGTLLLYFSMRFVLDM